VGIFVDLLSLLGAPDAPPALHGTHHGPCIPAELLTVPPIGLKGRLNAGLKIHPLLSQVRRKVAAPVAVNGALGEAIACRDVS
jgi:hypothetical protein